MTRMLLVEDHTALREALAVALEGEPGFTVTGQAGTLAEARPLLEDMDLAVVDLHLPDGTGIELISEIFERNPSVPILVLTSSVDREMFGRAIEAGASAVLHKSADIAEVLETIRKLRDGEQIYASKEMFELLRLGSRRRERDKIALFAASSLTARERQILEALAEGLDGKEISGRLGMSRETEHAHLVRIYAKLGVRSRVGALAFALRHGLVSIPPASRRS
ncbi:response regulator [Rubrobacter marinus]|uniref:Response regulator n=1 Tax=Rubrobacter marinus TaxID=2653852 RepID=A0A6G8PW51_9ACTN|nr:response regulator transcription factor [Rubrobacter marinus]QIN78434.1 response regulator [Rubrobacter marinus]